MNRNRPNVSIPGILIMGGTVGAQVLTLVSFTYAVAYFEPPLLTFLATINNPYLGTILGLWVVVMTILVMVKATFGVGAEANKFLNLVLSCWTRKSPESS